MTLAHRGKTIWGYNKKVAICTPRTEGSEETNTAGTLYDSKSGTWLISRSRNLCMQEKYHYSKFQTKLKTQGIYSDTIWAGCEHKFKCPVM